MSDGDELVYECELDAPVEKVWRALTVPEYLERWLKLDAPADLAVVAEEENRSLTYRWRDGGEGVEDSLVTFELSATEEGGTWFRLTHVPVVMPVAANSNEADVVMMLAA
ncbi:MAG: SRPBCC domain-containing protein [Candidatus Devosia phytovorans]|uniref:SRPBCC domain-containing protein n=1 Tax=Candidatus Devosia phytovorans TaxID=3121372 RepID=A0AAJ6B1P7_9HYPH|nr:SRPBCC domain-containing protein [Devosia sp.]WEK05589.1 MAG: SRPBCC domain-containing protein [Devosia sp.]